MTGETTQLFSADISPHTVESLYAEHGAPRPWTYWLVLAGVIGAFASLPLIKVDVSVRAAGLVRPTTERAELRPAISAHIAEVLVHDNDRVLAGQPLLVLASRELGERLSRNQAQQAEHAALIADLKNLTAGFTEGRGGNEGSAQPTHPSFASLPSVKTPGSFLTADSADTVDKKNSALSVSSVQSVVVFKEAASRREQAPRNLTTDFTDSTDGKPSVSAVRSTPSMVAFQTAALRQEHAQFLAQADSYRLAEAKARNELARYTTLAGKGIATQQELDNARYEAERLQAESRLLIEQTLSRWQTRLRDEVTAQADLVSQAEQLKEAQAQSTLRAPAAGVLVGFNGWSAGGFVAAGQSLGAVSPEDTLQVETYVSPRDIGLVRVGQAARLQIDAYPYTQWGTLDGTVTAISGDLATTGTSQGGTVIPNGPSSSAAFKVHVRPAADFLTLPNGLRGDLKKGLTLSARFLVARRSVFQLLYDDVSAWLDPADTRRD